MEITGRVWELKKAWRDGTRFVRLDPQELIARICAMVLPPWFHMIRFHGVLAPNAKLREQVVASAKPYVPSSENTAPNPVQLPLFGKHFDEPETDVDHKTLTSTERGRPASVCSQRPRKPLATRGGVNASIAKWPLCLD